MACFDEDFVNHAVFFGFDRIHPVVTVGIAFHFFKGLAGMVGDDVVEFLFELLDFAGCNLDVGSLSLCSAHRLGNHHTRMVKGKSFAFGSCNEEHCGRCKLSKHHI